MEKIRDLISSSFFFCLVLFLFAGLLIFAGVQEKTRVDKETAVTNELKEKASAVDEEILSLSGNISLDNSVELISVENDYNALPLEGKRMVKNIDMLTSARTQFDSLLKEDNKNWEDAKAVDAAIDSLPEVITLSDEQAIYDARGAYNALNGTARGYVSDYDALCLAEEKYIKLLERRNT